ncbi:chemerin chemokine-like receptor 1 [Chelydra serpentina]|uniref:Chemerin chemokine-like receptor 1 n=1 Tax=Chelydra serpentina TaxID=8475 RepID=A0A8T1S350_CHESE|nr:chemerin chemokine-like receptor 1 [Chelydra serpentina]
MFSSSFHLTAISADHCVTTVCPAWAQNHCTLHRASLVTLGIWILAVTVSWCYHGLCSDQSLLLRENGEAASVATQFLVGFLVPLALISICLATLAAKLGQKRTAWSKEPLRTLLVLHVIFFLCWSPYHVIAFLQTSPKIGSSIVNAGIAFACVLTYFSSCLNPIFYLTMEEEFQRYRQRARNPQTTDNSGLEPAD